MPHIFKLWHSYDLIQHYLVFEARMATPRLGIDLEDKFARKDAYTPTQSIHPVLRKTWVDPLPETQAGLGLAGSLSLRWSIAEAWLQVFISIYDLNRDWLTANQVGKKLLHLGAFHAAVEVYGILTAMQKPDALCQTVTYLYRLFSDSWKQQCILLPMPVRPPWLQLVLLGWTMIHLQSAGALL